LIPIITAQNIVFVPEIKFCNEVLIFFFKRGKDYFDEAKILKYDKE